MFIYTIKHSIAEYIGTTDLFVDILIITIAILVIGNILLIVLCKVFKF